MESENEVDMFDEVDYEPESDNEEEQRAGDTEAEGKGKRTGDTEARASNRLILTGIPKSVGRKEVQSLFAASKLQEVELYNTGTQGVCAVVTLSSPEEVARSWSELDGKVFPNTKGAAISFADYDRDLHETLKSARSEYPESKGREQEADPSEALNKRQELETLASEKLAWARKLKVAELREELGKRGHDTKGLKAVLLKKLEELIVIEAAAINDLPPPTTKKEGTDNVRKANDGNSQAHTTVLNAHQNQSNHQTSEQDQPQQLSGQASQPIHNANVGQERLRSTHPQKAKKTLECPFDILEQVAGAHFSVVKNIEKDTNARIEIDKEFDPCLFHITGSVESVEDAHEILTDLIRDNQRKLSSTGGGVSTHTGPQQAKKTLECPFDILEQVAGAQFSIRNNIERDTGARIEIDKEFDPCLFHITGSVESVENAHEILKGLIREESPRIGGRQGGPSDKIPSNNVEELLDCPRFAVRSIIGRNGQEVNRLERNTRTRIDINQRGDPCKITIRGKTRESVDKASKIIRDLIQEETGKREASSDVDCPQLSYKGVIGSGGKVIQKIKRDTKTIIDTIHQDRDPCTFRVCGSRESVDEACKLLRDLIQKETANREASSDVEELLDCPRFAVRGIIGPGGQVVNRLQDDTRAKIDINKRVDPCKITIRGKTRESVDKACKIIRDLIQEESSKHEGSGPSDKIASKEVEEFLDCPRYAVGGIIGFQGKAIQKIQKDTGTWILIEKEFDPFRITIRGSRESVDDACKILRDIIKEESPRGMQGGPSDKIPSNDVEELLDCPKFAVRSIIGRNGQEVNRLERDTRTWIDINKIVDPCKITIRGKTRESVDKASKIIRDLIQEETGKREASSDVEELLDCPKFAIQGVIGPRGQVVNRLQDDTRAKIDINKRVDPCKITIRGSRECVDKAIKSLTDLIQKETANREASNNVEELLDCPKFAVRSIIGRNGQEVNRLERDTRTWIDINQRGDPCKITIRGKTRESVDKASKIIRDLIQEETGKREASSDVEELLDCPKFAVWNIIGRQGTVVDRLERDTRTKIKINREVDPCKITIRGKTRESVDKASKIIRDLIQEESGNQAQPAPGGLSTSTTPQQVKKTLECPFDILKQVAGAQFSTVKDIEKDTGVRVEIDQKFDPCLFHITGSLESVENAHEILKGLISDNEVTECIECSRSAMKNIIGPKGVVIKKIKKDTRTWIDNENDDNSSKITIRGSRESVDEASKIIRDMIQEDTSNREASNDVEELLDCPKFAVRSIIGPGGQVVNRLERDTRTRIDINQREDPCKITIRGSRESVDKASKIIRDLIQEKSSKREASNDVEELLDCPKFAVRSIIGRNGQEVKRLERDTRTKIKINREVDPCKITIRGSRESVDKANKIIRDLIQEETEKREASNDVEECIDCPNSVIQGIIGPRYQLVRGLEDDTRTRIDINREVDPCKISIFGSRESVDEACKIVRDLIQDSSNEVEELLDCPNFAVQKISWRQVVTMLRRDKRTWIDINQRGDPCKITIRGKTRESVDEASKIIRDLIQEETEKRKSRQAFPENKAKGTTARNGEKRDLRDRLGNTSDDPREAKRPRFDRRGAQRGTRRDGGNKKRKQQQQHEGTKKRALDRLGVKP